MTNKYIADRREERARMMRIRKERQALKTKRTIATVVAIVLVAACVACVCVIGVTVTNNLLPASHTAAAAEVTKLGMISADTGMDTATQASSQDTTARQPAASGSALHFYGQGSTTEGYGWTYSADNDIVKVDCNYNFGTHNYDLVVTGKAAGTANVILYYSVDDNNQVSIPITVSVDSNLNITQI